MICIMQSSVKKPPAEDLALARRALLHLAQRVQTTRVAADTGIHQSQVSRLFRGQFKRVSPNVRTLLAYAHDPARYAGAKEPSDAARTAVIRAALRTWDATPEGARALVRLLRSVERLRGARPTRATARARPAPRGR
jgi:transcriptional regulator with XRE-family HTH domain